MVNIYIITNHINGKQYVGKTKHSLQHRFEGHACVSRKSNTHIHKAIVKYGKENFTIALLDRVPENEWKQWETYYIKKCRTHYTQGGYNSTWGGEDNPMDNERCRKAHYKAMHCPEYHLKQVLANQGFKHSKASIEKMKQIQAEVARRPEWILKNKLNHEKQKKKVVMCDLQENPIKQFNCIKDALIFVGSKYPSATNTITSCINKYKKNGKPKTVYGYVWKYLDK